MAGDGVQGRMTGAGFAFQVVLDSMATATGVKDCGLNKLKNLEPYHRDTEGTEEFSVFSVPLW
jgi:hypothetical protein